MDIQILIAVGILFIAFIAIIKSRLGSRYGELRPSKEVAEAYDFFRVDPDVNYYITGSDVYPNAIIGIDKTWTLKSDLWKKIDLRTQDMKELVQNMRVKTMEQSRTLHGFVILDNFGRNIGNWFSIMGIGTTIEITGERQVIVYTPPLDTYLHS